MRSEIQELEKELENVIDYSIITNPGCPEFSSFCFLNNCEQVIRLSFVVEIRNVYLNIFRKN